eukprot:320741-Chlamydomonas_euryale.AAC.1
MVIVQRRIKFKHLYKTPPTHSHTLKLSAPHCSLPNLSPASNKPVSAHLPQLRAQRLQLCIELGLALARRACHRGAGRRVVVQLRGWAGGCVRIKM